MGEARPVHKYRTMVELHLVHKLRIVVELRLVHKLRTGDGPPPGPYVAYPTGRASPGAWSWLCAVMLQLEEGKFVAFVFLIPTILRFLLV